MKRSKSLAFDFMYNSYWKSIFPMNPQVRPLVGLSVCANFMKGLEVTLQRSYRSKWFDSPLRHYKHTINFQSVPMRFNPYLCSSACSSVSSLSLYLCGKVVELLLLVLELHLQVLLALLQAANLLLKTQLCE